jgi:hypothetical protein
MTLLRKYISVQGTQASPPSTEEEPSPQPTTTRTRWVGLHGPNQSRALGHSALEIATLTGFGYQVAQCFPTRLNRELWRNQHGPTGGPSATSAPGGGGREWCQDPQQDHAAKTALSPNYNAPPACSLRNILDNVFAHAVSLGCPKRYPTPWKGQCWTD